MSKAAYYRAKAEEVEAIARHLSMHHERESLLSIARTWRQLEADAAKREKGDRLPEPNENE